MRNFFLTILIIIIFYLRFLPSYITGFPFSIDAWPLIRDINILGAYSPISLLDSKFDGYNNFWPGTILILSILKVVSGYKMFELVYPAVSNFIFIIFLYLLIKFKLNRDIALLSTLLIAFIYPFSFFTSGFVKEVVALPMYIMILYIVIREQKYGLIIPVVISLVITHHLTSLVTLLIITSIIILDVIRYSYGERRFPFKRMLVATYLSTVGYLHYILFGINGMCIPIDLDSTLIVVSYYGVFMFMAWLISKYREFPNYIKFVIFIMPFIATLLFGYYMLIGGITIGGPRPGFNYIIYGLHLAIIPSYIALGIGYIVKNGESEFIYWLMAITSILASQFFVPTLKPNIPYYRLLNFAIVPSIIIASAIIHNKLNYVVIPLLAGLVITCSVLSFIASYNGDPYFGYQWWYNEKEYFGANYIKSNIIGVISVVGDLKVRYLLTGYFSIPVDVKLGYDFLRFNYVNKDFILFIYKNMIKIGFLNDVIPTQLNIQSEILVRHLRVYDNGYVYHYLVTML